MLTDYFRALYFLYSMNRRAYWNRNKLIDYQNRQLRRILKYAYDYVPFYHNKFRKLGIKPSDIKTAEHLRKLPILRKDEIRRNLQGMISKQFRVNDLKMLSTSGSTGQPLFLYISRLEDRFRKAKHLRANISCGQRLTDRWVTITSPRHFEEHTRFQQLLGFYAPIPVSIQEDVANQLVAVQRMHPDVLDGYSSSLLLLAREVSREGVEDIRPRIVISGAELIDDSSRRFVENIFQSPTYDQYACIELERIAWQCSEKAGYHIDADALVVEFADRQGEDAGSERGEIVCSSLFNFAMPLIRYAVGDVGTRSDEECSCGRTLPLMKEIEGRKDSLLMLPDGRILSPRTFTVAISTFKHYHDIEQFRVTQKKIDAFEIQVKPRSENAEDTIQAELEAHLRKTLRIERDQATFHIKFVDDIPLDKSGKLMMVVSELKLSS